jgi:hypothetical protein
MLNRFSRAQLVGGWFVAVVAIFACSVAAGASTTANAGELWLATCLVPPVVMLLVWPAAPTLTVAELLHRVNTPEKADRQTR